MDTCCHPIDLCTARKITCTVNYGALPSAEDKHRAQNCVKTRLKTEVLVPRATKVLPRITIEVSRAH